MGRAKDLRDLKATSSLLSFLRYGGALDISTYQLRSAQSNRGIVLYKDRRWKDEFTFSVEGLDLAISTIIKDCYRHV